MELKGACAIVTGGARGIGRAIATALAAKGASVVIASRTASQVESAAEEVGALDAVRSAGGRLLGLVADVTDTDDVARLAERAEAQFGPARVLVNNAGSLAAVGPTWQLDREQWLQDVTTNLCGTFLVCREVMPGMVERGEGYVINMVGGGATSPHTFGSGYGCSKAGVLAFTETLAIEAAETGVVVFPLSPGFVRTRMTLNLVETEAGRRWRPFIGDWFKEGKDVPPERAAEMVLNLLSGRADRLSGCLFSAGEDFDAIVQNADRILAADALRLRLKPWK
jgi:NAD(P)-dependent dehydrogenase (short-subunit alcohol dehydrogenase family)